MANTLSSASIIDGSTVEAWHVTQSVDAFNGVQAYDIIISGSLTLGSGTSMAGTASYANNALSASHAITASYAENAGGATVDTGSLMTTASVSSNIITFTKGDATTFNLTVDTGSAITTPTASLLTTASVSNATITFTKGDASTFNFTVNNVVSANTASFVTTAQTASFVTGSDVNGVVTAASTQDGIFKDPNGGSPISAKGAILAIGSIQLSGGTGLGSVSPTLAGLSNGQNCYIMVTAVNGGGVSPGEIYDASISTGGGLGRVQVTNVGGSSNALVSYVVFS